MADGYTELTVENLKTPDGIRELNRMLRILYENIPGDTNTIKDFIGYGDPETVITAGVGSTYRRIDGGALSSFYVKESGSLAVGWVAK